VFLFFLVGSCFLLVGVLFFFLLVGGVFSFFCFGSGLVCVFFGFVSFFCFGFFFSWVVFLFFLFFVVGCVFILPFSEFHGFHFANPSDGVFVGF